MYLEPQELTPVWQSYLLLNKIEHVAKVVAHRMPHYKFCLVFIILENLTFKRTEHD